MELFKQHTYTCSGISVHALGLRVIGLLNLARGVRYYALVCSCIYSYQSDGEEGDIKPGRFLCYVRTLHYD